MKLKKTILSCLLALGFVSASAQAQQQGTTVYDFNPHWYVTVNPLGLQHTLGEVDFGDLNSYNVQAAVGYNFSKIFGARLAVNAWQSKAGSKIENNTYKWGWKYVAPTVDLTVNLSNALCGFNPNRVFNLSIFGGVGANLAFSNDEAQDANAAIEAVYPNIRNNALYGDQALRYLWDGSKARLLGQFGAIADFRLSEKVSLNIELNANTLNDKYNSKKAGNSDWYFNALAGVKVNLGKTYTTRYIKPTEPVIEYVDRVIHDTIVVKEGPEVIEPLRRDIFFLINKTNIRPSEEQKVKDVADYLNKYPKARVVISGYADAGTGNNRINDRLAAGRADVVVKALTEKYGIAPSRITFDSHGSRVQPFPEDNDSNRVTICIAE